MIDMDMNMLYYQSGQPKAVEGAKYTVQLVQLHRVL